jgi:FAD/FMN-containing dehydrogenase
VSGSAIEAGLAHIPRASVRELGARLRGRLLAPDADGYQAASSGFNLAVPQRPALIVGATGVADTAYAVRFAAAHGLPVAVQATGHGMSVPADGAVLVRTDAIAGVRVDPGNRLAWIGAGVRWAQVVHEAAVFGLAPLCGSCPAVGAVSYTLGGGLGPVARTFGYAADHVRELDLVTAEGQPLRVGPDREPDLFWALLGGKGNFGAVTSMVIGLVPLRHLYGGGLYFPGSRATEVLQAWREWTGTLPEEMTSSVAWLHPPDHPGVPPQLRTGSVLHIRVAHVGSRAEGEALVRPLRSVAGCVLDTLAVMPYTAIGMLHNDPVAPRAFCDATAMLRELAPATVHALVEAVAEDVARAAVAVELRHLGGALGRPPRVANAVGHRGAGYLLSAASDLAPGSDPEQAARGHERLLAGVAPWATGGKCLNFIDGPAGAEVVRAAFEPADHERLRRLKLAYDPANLFRVNHNIPPAGAG